MTYVSTVLADGAVGFWQLGEASGTVAADTVGNQNGTYTNVGGITLGQSGLPSGGTSALFTAASSGYVNIPVVAAQQVGDTFTIEAWVTHGSTTGAIRTMFACTNTGPGIDCTAAAFAPRTARNGIQVISTATLSIPNDGAFHHVVWTKNGATNHIYVDGVDVTGAVTNTAIPNAATAYQIAANTNAGGSYYNGKMAMVALYPTALSAGTVSTHYTLGISPPAPVNTVAPVVSGSTAAGSVLSCTAGSWTGDDGRRTYQWRSGGTNIAGATQPHYISQVGEVAALVDCVVTAYNGISGTPQASSNSILVTAAGVTPYLTAFPTVAGTPTVGHTLRCWQGIWANSPTSYSYQWTRDGSPIGAAASSTYTLVAADTGHTVDCVVTAANGFGSTSQPSLLDALPIASSRSVTWDPTARQTWEPDTIWLFDPDQEAAFWPTPGAGGMIDGTGRFVSTPATALWSAGNFTVGPGRFRRGLQSSHVSNNSVAYMPSPGLPSNSFTVELWAVFNAAWSTNTVANTSFVTFGYGGSATIDIGCSNTSGTLYCAVTHYQAGAPVSFTLTDTLVPGANTPVWVGVTYDGTTLTLYRQTIGGTIVTVGTHTMAAPLAWAGGGGSVFGSVVMGGWIPNPTLTPTGWTVSEIKISRQARTPGVPATVTTANTVTVTDTPAGTTVKPYLRGGVHYYAPVGNAGVEAVADGYIAMGRTDKFLNACPVKAGAPDGTHPTAGHSGSYSYDWRPADHTLDYYKRLGIIPYIDLDATPQLLGGANAPFTPTQCADPNYLVGNAPWNPQVPSDFAAFATIASDFVYHVLTDRGDTVPYWSFWNEPDGNWAGTPTQLFSLYATTSTAVRALFPSIKLGGLEIASWADKATWVAPFISYCASNSVLCDLISYHSYTEDLADSLQAQQDLAGYCTTYSFAPVPILVLSEWGWSGVGLHAGGWKPFGDLNYWLNDWGAAVWAARLYALQQTTTMTAAAFYSLGTVTTSDAGFFGTGLIATTHPWAGQNTFNMAKRLGE